MRAAILTGAGTAFCAGGDVTEMRDGTGYFEGSPAVMREKYRTGLQRLPAAIYGLEVPLVAAINGPAAGAGLDISLMCDIRIAADTATFAKTFVRLGIIAGIGGNWFLPRVLGKARAAELAFTADTINAATALEWGLVSEVVEGSQLMVAAHALAARIARNPPEALRMTKRLMKEGEAHRSLHDAGTHGRFPVDCPARAGPQGGSVSLLPKAKAFLWRFRGLRN